MTESALLIRLALTMMTVMMQMVMSQLGPRLLHGRYQSAHRLLVTLEAVRFLQLA